MLGRALRDGFGIRTGRDFAALYRGDSSDRIQL